MAGPPKAVRPNWRKEKKSLDNEVEGIKKIIPYLEEDLNNYGFFHYELVLKRKQRKPTLVTLTPLRKGGDVLQFP
jgi:hypothetical protein